MTPSPATRPGALGTSILRQELALPAPVFREPSDEAVRSAASEGVRTPAVTLPFLDRIQDSFGRHPLSHVKAHVGPAAAKTSRTMSALAFASGDHVVFGGTPDLRTAAHEAAHVVQQRAGVRLAGGVGREGDAYERHAGAVADTVVAGRSAEGMLEPFAALSKVKQNGTPTSAEAGSVVQRAIVMEGKTYRPEDLEAFQTKYPEVEWKAMLSAMSEFEHYPRTIKDALEDPRNFYLTAEKIDDEVFYLAEADSLPKRVQGRMTREAGSRPVLVKRPQQGFEELRISGLIMCIGVVIEARKAGMIQAASGSHFVTPEYISKGEINEKGQQRLEDQIRMVQPHGILSATLMHIKGPKETKGKDEKDAFEALNLIVPFLLSRRLSQVNILDGESTRSYKLEADGTSTLT